METLQLLQQMVISDCIKKWERTPLTYSLDLEVSYATKSENILSLDSTKDGKFLLATCKNFLILLSTTNNGKNGFTQKLTKEKPVPRILSLHPNDIIKYKINSISFSPAHFDEMSSGTEKYIISSTSNFLITWSLRKLLAGKVFSYEVILYPSI